jgi:formylglycine-generating enzyme required for sulfatase activity
MKLVEQEKQLVVSENKVSSQDKRYTAELKKMVERSKKTEENLNEAVQLAQNWEKQLKERAAEYKKLAKTSETDKTRFQQLASEEQARAAELSRQLTNLQTKAQSAKEQTAQVKKEVEARPFRDKLKGGGQGPEMIILAAGNFLMGSPQTESGRYGSEGPQHSVTISRPFALSINEITFAEYDAFAKATGRQLPNDKGWGRDDRPVIYVSWEDATAYAAWLSEQTEQQYRLPTEAEWEYAGRAGSATMYSFGDGASQLHEYAWYRENSESKSHPVRKRKPNAWGLYDMHGNVYEWVEDDWHDDYEGAPPDGKAWKDEPKGADRVIRGGSWYSVALLCRAANRNDGSPGNRDFRVGFRLARSVALGP